MATYKNKTTKIFDTVRSYRVIIEPDEKNTFHGFVPVLIGCHTWGKTINETRNNIRDAIDVYIRSLQIDNEPIPEDKGIEFVEIVQIPSKHFLATINA
ncbi:MAG: type II toxin-antitoxin system HicB family antitoxin [Patescibacteria group bacterium]